MLDRNRLLKYEGIKNNHQIMALILPYTPEQANADNQLYDKVQKAKDDATLLLNDSSSQFMQVRCSRN